MCVIGVRIGVGHLEAPLRWRFINIDLARADLEQRMAPVNSPASLHILCNDLLVPDPAEPVAAQSVPEADLVEPVPGGPISTAPAADATAHSPAPRLVTLVFDEPKGQTAPFVVESPWWQEAAPVIEEAERLFKVPITLVRLLETSGPFPGGALTYLAEAPSIDRSLLSPTDVSLADDPKRASYADVGGPGEMLRWAEEALDRAGLTVIDRSRQIRTWNLAAIWQVPTNAGAMWLKATPPFLAHEPAVLDALAHTGHVPTLIEGAPGRALMNEVAGEDGYGIGGDQMIAAVDTLRSIQRNVDLSTLSSVPALDAAAFADRSGELADRWSSSLDRDPQARLHAVQNELADRFSSVAHIGSTLVHGDFHGGNLKLAPGQWPVVLDWGDSFIGSPLFDVAALESYEVSDADRIREHWLDRLGATDEDWRAFEPVAKLLLPLVYQRFCDNIEQAELPYHHGDILPALTNALESVRS